MRLILFVNAVGFMIWAISGQAQMAGTADTARDGKKIIIQPRVRKDHNYSYFAGSNKNGQVAPWVHGRPRSPYVRRPYSPTNLKSEASLKKATGAAGSGSPGNEPGPAIKGLDLEAQPAADNVVVVGESVKAVDDAGQRPRNPR